MNQRFDEAVERIFERLSAFSDEEFQRQVEAHADGDFAKILTGTDALATGETESDVFWSPLAELDLTAADIAASPSFYEGLTWAVESPYEAVTITDPADFVAVLHYDQKDLRFHWRPCFPEEPAGEALLDLSVFNFWRADLEKVTERKEEVYYFDMDLKWAA